MAAITGVGVICPLGAGFPEVSGALIDGESAWTGSGGPARVLVDPTASHDTPKTYLDRASALALAAAALARRQAGWSRSGSTPGIAVGTAYGCPDSMLKFWESVELKGPRLANSIYFTHSYPNTPASIEAIEHDLAGPHFTFCQGMASGGLAAAAAVDAIRRGRAARMMTGGFEALAPDDDFPSEAPPSLFFPTSRPWPGEGAVMLTLENEAEAPLGRIVGTGASSFLAPITSSRDGRFTPGAPSEEDVRAAISRSMMAALNDAGRSPSEADLMVLSACGRPLLDRCEAQAVQALCAQATATTVSQRIGCAPGAAAFYGILAALIALREEWIVETGCPVGPDAARINLAIEPIERPVSLALVNAIDDRGASVTLALTP
ncbi:MAG TPA: beta-ketoacyl synthase N-terminal-like domain-containing protein [Armatimonadota bacterium]|nr:beta-ketoacyl synthase N-terminal-like domain-containing protein [Armatimonadota bacterium]